MVGLIDCDNFFCSCERVFRPDLVRTPLVVLSNNDGCVVARSREVKAMGIPEGLPYYQLREQYAGLPIVAFSSNYTLYGDLSARVMATLRDEVPEVVQYSIDEAFLNLEGMEQRVDLKSWGEELCRKVTRCTGIPVSLGIAPTHTLAKMASRFAKRYSGYRKCCVIANDTQRIKALSLTPVGDIWGIGRRITRSLGAYGIETALDFAGQERRWVRRHYHVTGERTWDELNGRSVISVDALDASARQTIMTSRSFARMLTDKADLRAHVANYAARCAMKLRRQHSVCSQLTVFMQSNHFRPDLPQHDCSAFHVFTTPTANTVEIVDAATAIADTIFRQGISYKRAGVMVADISDAGAVQPDLFTFDADRRRKYDEISAALDCVNRRHGADTVVMGAQQYRERDADGRAIRFVNAIRRSLKSPDYSTRLGAFTVG